MDKRYAYVTLLSGKRYLNGIYWLNSLFQNLESKYPLVVLYTDLEASDIYKLKKYCNGYKNVILKPIISKKFENTEIDNFATTFNKFYIFTLKEYEKVCFLDLDLIILKNFDFMFDKVENLFFKFNEHIGYYVGKNDMIKCYGVWGGLFFVRTNLLNFDNLENKYRKTFKVKSEETVWNDIIENNKNLKQELETSDQSFYFGNKYYLHGIKMWTMPFIMNLVKPPAKIEELDNITCIEKICKTLQKDNVINKVEKAREVLYNKEFWEHFD